ncbi:protein kinase domain-containing protein [Blastococcus xanthinilyticus]|uniref:non-specific serine/threonine protein kinase n=1 Tax=Blastococcus xanthinilyticus TaxID=1564164 RepID=A0A5S5CRF5_9ACTN|nr:protein kinase [Blastococcus xanthinilyticus]TYP86477.1 serine/threonine-protein kinase [Blastococcus xanthinilyticus]
MALGIGSLLAGRYEITAPIATGGMGEVWKARDQVLDRIVAAKVLKTEYTNDPSFLARFRNEARHTAALSHPNIASVYDYGETTDDSGVQTMAFLVMEFVEGQPLVTILHEEGRLPVDWTLHVLGQAADGLSAAHRAGVVHRDIKPGNLIVRPDGVVKLTDFGIAQARDAAPLTKTGMVVGTAQYLSPEQAQGLEVNAASDVYSLGVVGFECLAGVRPFDGASQVAIALAHINRPPPPLPGDIPPTVRLLIDRALAKDPSDRFPDGGAFAEAVRRVADGGQVAGAGAGGVAVVAPATAPTQIVHVGADGNVSTDGHTQVFATPAAGMPAVSPATGGRPMPPLAAPPGREDDWTRGDEPPGSGRRWAWPLAAVVLLLVIAGVTYVLLTQDGAGQDRSAATPTSDPTTSTSETAGILLDPAVFVGRDADTVEAELNEAGVVLVRREEADEATLADLGRALEENAVAAIDPSGELATAETEVTLFVAVDGWQPEDEQEEPTPTTPPTSESSTPSETTTPSETEDEDEPEVEETPGNQGGTTAPKPTASTTRTTTTRTTTTSPTTTSTTTTPSTSTTTESEPPVVNGQARTDPVDAAAGAGDSQ